MSDVPSFKRLVVCCDGTWNRPRGEGGLTNVAKVACSVAASDADGRDQLVHYHEGVGTKWYEKIRGGVAGFGLSRVIKECYAFLSAHYEPGDKIYLFGFSRGAFTARSLASLIRNCGLLRSDQLDRIDDAYRLYRDREKDPYSLEADLFRRTWSHEADVFFIGVWDTVGSLGLPGLSVPRPRDRWSFHDVQLSQTVRYAYHALAADERRRPFTPTLWVKNPKPTLGLGQTLEQVWFSGAHSDVGGGYLEPGLSEIPLCWMVQKAMDAGLTFRPGWFARLDPQSVLHAREGLGEPPPDVLHDLHEDAARVAAGRAPPSASTARRDEDKERRARAREVNPDPKAACHRSLKGLYWVLQPVLRPAPRPIPFISRHGLPYRLSDTGIERLSHQSCASSAPAHLSAHAKGDHVGNLSSLADSESVPTTLVPTIEGVLAGHPVVPMPSPVERKSGAVPFLASRAAPKE